VLHQIGAGTLGPVFRGHDTQRERLVAVKVFKLDQQPEQAHQIVAGLERIVASDLAHQAIATPLAAGLTDGAPYLASDYIAADSMDLAVREFGALLPSDALQVGARLASALDHAVAAGFTHGCLHPRDVLMSAREARLTGIGVGQLLAEIGIAPPIRRPYTAPERLAGSAWDRRADIFSLAALVHELLWGRRISGIGGRAVENMTALPGGDLEALKRVFKRALAEDPMERHPTGKIFIDALKRALPDVAESVAFNMSVPLPVEQPGSPPPNLRLATTPRSPSEDMQAPLLPLEPPRFTEVEAHPDLSSTPSGPSILETAQDPLDLPLDHVVGGDTTSDAAHDRQAQEDFALGWLPRETDPAKPAAPFELRTFAESDVVTEPTFDREPTPLAAPLPVEAVKAVEPAKPVESSWPIEIATPPTAEPPPEPALTTLTEPPQRLDLELPIDRPAHRMARTGARTRSTNPLVADVDDELAPLPVSAAVETGTFVESRKPLRDDTPPEWRAAVDQPLAPDPAELTMLERSRSAVWPLVLALAIGGALGFAGGYAVGVRGEPPASSAGAPASGSDFTEGTVAAAPKSAAGTTAPSATPPAASKPAEPEAASPAPPRPAAPAPSPSNPPVESRRADAASSRASNAAWKAGRLNVRSDPAGARVFVDNREVGRTPTSVQDLTEGPHVVRLMRDGYAAQDRRIVISRERPAQMVNASLVRQASPAPPPAGRGAPVAGRGAPPPATGRSSVPPTPSTPAGTGTLVVDSRPTGAHVFLNNRLIGVTPLTLQGITAGDHVIRLQHDGYETWTGAVRVVPNESARVTASLGR